ncbi:MAG: hypothetical protein R3Y19_02695 [Rikenellaceae bacterium]
MRARKKIVSNQLLFEDISRLISLGERVTLLTKGRSMLPFIRGGVDSVELCGLRGDIRWGDILLVRMSDSLYVLHRVVEVDSDRLTLMGDGNIRGVERCLVGDVLARVSLVVCGSGRVYDPRSGWRIFLARFWYFFLPLRRYILAFLRLFER